MDLNATAVELAEISLWLDSMVSGLEAPWFGLRLRRGNSLIGARRAVYTRAQVNDKSWLNKSPADMPMTGLIADMNDGVTAQQTDGRIHHFLLPAGGWGSAVEANEAVALAPEAAAALRKWRSAIASKPSRKQVDALVELAHRVESLWQITLRRLQIAEAEARRNISLWDREEPERTQAVTREQIESTLSSQGGAYRRLRRVMDAWSALWFWPLTDNDGVTPPILDQWIEACQALLGREPEARQHSRGMTPLASTTTIASSTTSPMARTNPKSVSVLMLNENGMKKMNVPTSDTGTASIGIADERKLPRKRKTTTITSPIASKSVLSTSRIDVVTKSVLS